MKFEFDEEKAKKDIIDLVKKYGTLSEEELKEKMISEKGWEIL